MVSEGFSSLSSTINMPYTLTPFKENKKNTEENENIKTIV